MTDKIEGLRIQNRQIRSELKKSKRKRKKMISEYILWRNNHKRKSQEKIAELERMMIKEQQEASVAIDKAERLKRFYKAAMAAKEENGILKKIISIAAEHEACKCGEVIGCPDDYGFERGNCNDKCGECWNGALGLD